jgi:GNAT superfamily N-acetyltransferase
MRWSKAETGDAQAISALALETCKQFIFGTTSVEGRDTLRELYSTASIKQCIQDGDHFVLAWHGEELAGAAAMRREDNHVYLFFVAGHYHRQGLGRKLMEALVTDLDQAGHVTLNSSIYAINFYRRLGLEATGPVATAKGVEFLPMQLLL